MKLEVKDASIGYKKQVLSSNINMASEPGMVTAILGQNGCGKTTFVKSLMKLIPWCGGGAFLDGVDMRNIKDRQLWRKMAYVPQKSTSVPYSVLDMVLIGRNPYKSLFAQPDSNDRKMAEAASRRHLEAQPCHQLHRQGAARSHLPGGQAGIRLPPHRRDAGLLRRTD